VSSEQKSTDDLYKPVPGRGLNTALAIKQRLQFLQDKGFSTEQICKHFLDPGDVRNNIESFVGATEIPLGIVGPLLYSHKEKTETVYTLAGTLEGALIASMNRGAKAISVSGGFTAKVHHQRMVRAPLFILADEKEATVFLSWVNKNLVLIKKEAEKYSNHARLLNIEPFVDKENVHLRFVYNTSDAAGQNMSTTCTWHAMLFTVDAFFRESGIMIENFIIEGNGASDKKVSQYILEKGRGVSVTAECELKEEVIERVLRTSSEAIYRYYQPSLKITAHDGMPAFNINVANAVAAIFVATGQDLASIHESSLAKLELKKTKNGLHLKLHFPSLVIGTVGGGTSVPAQREALLLMDCAGTGKLHRFASLIAGFALSLEISTYAAIVSGEFAKAHEKLGRNKPAEWLLKNELTASFISKCLGEHIDGKTILSVLFDKEVSENGILTTITQRVNKKLTGFIGFDVQTSDGGHHAILTKSKPLDLEAIEGLHLMAASIDPKLSDLLYIHRRQLEYWNSHQKEIILTKWLSDNLYNGIPRFYGSFVNESREIYLLFTERMKREDFSHFDSENTPHIWRVNDVEKVIEKIHRAHLLFRDHLADPLFNCVQHFDPRISILLYRKIAELVVRDNDEPRYKQLFEYIGYLEQNDPPELPETIVHNDFNPRNVAVKKDGTVCIYDWELAVRTIPHRDIVEFLCFSCPLDFPENDFLEKLRFHASLATRDFGIEDQQWWKGYSYALKVFLVTRGAFYKVSEVLLKLKFGDRIMMNAFRMLEILDKG
jgi:hydroxymethylglutaryl-CoA reductase (NADPH)